MRIALEYGLGSWDYCKQEVINFIDYIRQTSPSYFETEVTLMARSNIDYIDTFIPATIEDNLADVISKLKAIQSDFAVQILPNNTFTRCKSVVKWIEWTMAGKIFIGPSFGEYSDLISPDIGFLYKSFQDIRKFTTRVTMNHKLIENSKKFIRSNLNLKNELAKLPKSNRIIFYGYADPWRVWEPYHYYCDNGIECLVKNGQLDTLDRNLDLVLPSDLVILPRATNLNYVEKVVKKGTQVYYEIDDYIFEPNNCAFIDGIAVAIQEFANIGSGFIVSTDRLKTVLGDFTQHKLPIIVRHNAVIDGRIK